MTEQIEIMSIHAHVQMSFQILNVRGKGHIFNMQIQTKLAQQKGEERKKSIYNA